MKLKVLALSAIISLAATIPSFTTNAIAKDMIADHHMTTSMGKTMLTWYGHAAFKIVTPAGNVVFVDPWLTNPLNKNGKADVDAIKRADLILVTHGHGDHIGDSVAIAKKTKAQLVATYDLGNAIVQHAGYPKEQSTMMTQGNFGGTVKLLNGDVIVTFVPAVHSSGISTSDGQTAYAGNPGGFLIQIKNGPVFYHTGDTDLFSDMALIPKMKKVDIMLSAIGDHFVMNPESAAEAVKLVNPEKVIPMHFGTFPLLSGNPEEFGKALDKKGIKRKLHVMEVHQTLNF